MTSARNEIHRTVLSGLPRRASQLRSDVAAQRDDLLSSGDEQFGRLSPALLSAAGAFPKTARQVVGPSLALMCSRSARCGALAGGVEMLVTASRRDCRRLMLLPLAPGLDSVVSMAEALSEAVEASRRRSATVW